MSAGCVLIILGNILAWCVGMNSLKISSGVVSSLRSWLGELGIEEFSKEGIAAEAKILAPDYLGLTYD